MIHKAKISHGHLEFNNVDRFKRDYKQYKDGTELYIDVSENEPNRSIQQNKYFYKIFDILEKENIGYTAAEFKTLILTELGFYEKSTNKVTGKKFVVYRPTSNLTVKEFSNLTEKLIMFCAEKLGVNIMTPEEYFET